MRAAWPIIRAGDTLRSGSVWVWQDGPWHFYTYIWRQLLWETHGNDVKFLYKINVKMLDKAISAS